MKSASGAVIVKATVMGVFEVRGDGKITAWRDYFDPAPFLQLAK